MRRTIETALLRVFAVTLAASFFCADRSTVHGVEAKPKALVRNDLHGDPLPPGVLARLGSIRLRHDSLKVVDVAFSPDGKLLASVGDDHTVRLWNSRDGRPVAVLRVPPDPLTKKPSDVNCLAFSPDGKFIAAGGPIHLVLWSVADRKPVWFHGVDAFEMLDIRTIVFARDGKLLITGSSGEGITLRNTKTGKRLAKQYQDPSPGVVSLDCSPDGKKLLVVSSAGRVQLRNVKDGKINRDWKSFEKKPVRALFAPDGRHIVTTIADGSFAIWSANGADRTFLADPGSSDPRMLQFAQGGRHLIGFSSKRKAFVIWDTSGKVVRLIGKDSGDGKHPGHGYYRDLAVTADGRHFAVGGSLVRIFDMATGRDLVPESVVPPILDVQFSRDGALINADGSVWNTATGRLICDIGSPASRFGHLSGRKDFRRTLRGTLFFGDDRRAYHVSARKAAIRLRDVASGREKWTLRVEGNIVGISPLPDDRLFVFTTEQHRQLSRHYYVLDASTGRVLKKNSPSGVYIRSRPQFVVSPNGETVAFRDSFETVQLMNIATGRPSHRLDTPSAVSRESVLSFSPSGSTLAWLDRDANSIRIWDVSTGEVLLNLAVLDDSSNAPQVIFSPQDDHVAVFRSADRGSRIQEPGPAVVSVYSLASRKRICQVALAGDRSVVGAECVFSPNGHYLAVKADSYRQEFNRLYVWDVRRDMPLFSPVRSVIRSPHSTGSVFSSDSRLLAAPDDRGNIVLWELISGKPAARLPCGSSAVLQLSYSPRDVHLVARLANATALVWSMSDLLPPDSTQPLSIERLWEDLAQKDTATARRAIARLERIGEPAVDFLADRLSSSKSLSKEIETLIEQLSDAQFVLRERATKRLIRLGTLADGALRKAQGGADVETKRRLQTILKRLPETPSARISDPDVLRYLRAIEVVEHVGGKPATRILRLLAGRDPGDLPSAAAADALERMQP